MYQPWMIRSGSQQGTSRNFGVELEFNECDVNRNPISTSQVAQALIAAGIPSRRVRDVGSYARNGGSQWYCGRDASAGSRGGYGNETTTPILQLDDDGECEELKTGMDAIAALNPRINRACGLHVHIDLPDFDWEDMQKLVALYARYEPFFFELLPPSRWDNHYCRPVRSSRWTQNNGAWSTTQSVVQANSQQEFAAAGRRMGRSAINLSHWWMNRRVEFRLGAGTMQYDKVKNWVVLLMALVNRVKAGDERLGGMSPVSRRVGAGRSRTFSTNYIGMALGIAASKWISKEEIHPASKACIGWINDRREKFGEMFDRFDATGNLPRRAR